MNGSIIRLASIHGEGKRSEDIELERDLEALCGISDKDDAKK